MKDCYMVPIALICIVLTGAIIGMIILKALAPGEIAAIEQLRKDASVINLHEAEDVMGKVVDTNMRLIKKRYYNSQWWSCLFVPNEYMNVILIPIPER